MLHASYIKGTDTYKVEMINTPDMIDQDMVDALALVETSVDRVGYRQNMELSVEQGLAYAIYRNDKRVGFVYNTMKDGRYLGASIKAIGFEVMIIAFKTMFEICDAHKISFNPHGVNINMFMSLLKGDSVRAWHHDNKHPVVVLKSDVVDKGFKAFHYLGMEWNV